MAAPNIDMIAASLRNCSLVGRTASSRAPLPFRVMGTDLMGEAGANGAAAAAEATLELNSDVALPYHWEQCLDLKTGNIYYINWSTGAKSTDDPRRFPRLAERYRSDDDGDSGGGEADDENDGGASGDDEADDSSEEEVAADDSDDEYGNCSSTFSSSSSASSRDTIGRGGTSRGRGAGVGSVLVAAGCRVCMMYVMIPKRAAECPRCGSHVLQFTRNRGR